MIHCLTSSLLLLNALSQVQCFPGDIYGGFQGCIYTNVLIHSWKCALLTSEDTFMRLLARKNILMALLHTQLSAYFKILALAWKGLG